MVSTPESRVTPSRPALTTLPSDYHEARYLSINQRGVLLWLNVMSLLPLFISGLIVFGLLMIYYDELGAPFVIRAIPDNLPSWVGIVLIIAVLPLHEWFHGLAIKRFGHTPRYGIKWSVLFATSDGAYFRRNEFVQIALAPLLVISIFGIALTWVLPLGVAEWIGLAVAVNAAGAIGDIWMTAVILSYDKSALVRDEADSMRIFTRKR